MSDFKTKFIETKIAIAKLQIALHEALLEESKKNPKISLEDLRIELDAIDSLNDAGPRRDIGPRILS